MTDPRRPPETLSAEDRALIAGIEAHYAPPPQSATQRAAFTAALDARLARARRRWRGLRRAAPLAAALGAAVLTWTLRPLDPGPPRSASAPYEAPLRLDAWERGIVLGDLDALEREDPDALALPADYAAIDGLFFEDS